MLLPNYIHICRTHIDTAPYSSNKCTLDYAGLLLVSAYLVGELCIHNFAII